MRRRRDELTTAPAARRRLRLLALVMVIVVAAAVGGFAVGGRVRSPAEAAADREAPTASPVTVPVERRALSNDVTRRGSVRFDNPTPLALAGQVGGDGGTQLVTKAPAPGDELDEGDVLIEVNGRPVLALQGDAPMYRTLRPGDTGDDVRQLEEALERLGFDPGPVDGIYDGSTELAVTALYEARGYSAQQPTEPEQAALTAARGAVSDADDRVTDAEATLAEAGKAMSRADLLGMQNEVAQAERALDAARADADRNVAQAAATAADRAGAVERARADHADAVDALSEARATGLDPDDTDDTGPPADGTEPPARCEATCIARLEAEVAARAAAITAAEATHAAALADADAVAVVADGQIGSAERALELARLRLSDAQAPKDTTRAEQQLATATARAAQAAADLAALDASTGVTVPAGEIVFLPSLPMRIDQVEAEVGETPPAGFVWVSGARLAVDSSIDAVDADLVRVGQDVTIQVPGIDRTLTGTVAEVAGETGTNGVTSNQVYVRITPTDDGAAADLNGAGVVVTIPIESTGGEVLVVPVAALTARADRTTWVELLDPDGTRHDVEVTAGLQADGLVEVSAADGSSLSEGDRVLIGGSDAGDESTTDDEEASDG